MQVTVQAIGAVPSLVVYPAIPFIAFGFFFIYWLSALLYLFSAGKIRQNNCIYNSCASYDLYSQTVTQSGCCGYTLHPTHNIVWAILFHLFVLFWAISFITTCSVTTISGAVASYYWARGETAVSLSYKPSTSLNFSFLFHDVEVEDSQSRWLICVMYIRCGMEEMVWTGREWVGFQLYHQQS
jgi:choline transporter-like protein 2/4/5